MYCSTVLLSDSHLSNTINLNINYKTVSFTKHYLTLNNICQDNKSGDKFTLSVMANGTRYYCYLCYKIIR